MCKGSENEPQDRDVPSEKISMVLFSIGNMERNKEIYISPAHTYEKSLANKIRLVDVRGLVEYKKYHIPKSINLPREIIRTKSFLRNKPLVLVSDGFHDAKMELLVTRLMNAGFSDVKILDGGVNSWQKIASFKGEGFTKTPYIEISALDLMAQKKYQHWVVLDLLEWKTLAKKSSEEILDYFRRLKESNTASETRFVITTKTGNDYLAISHVVSQLGWSNIFYLRGGQQAYEQSLKRQQLMWARTPGKQGGENRCGGRV